MRDFVVPPKASAHLHWYGHTAKIGVNLMQKHRRELFVQSNACEVVAQLIQLPQCREHAGLQEEVCHPIRSLTLALPNPNPNPNPNLCITPNPNPNPNLYITLTPTLTFTLNLESDVDVNLTGLCGNAHLSPPQRGH